MLPDRLFSLAVEPGCRHAGCIPKKEGWSLVPWAAQAPAEEPGLARYSLWFVISHVWLQAVGDKLIQVWLQHGGCSASLLSTSHDPTLPCDLLFPLSRPVMCLPPQGRSCDAAPGWYFWWCRAHIGLWPGTGFVFWLTRACHSLAAGPCVP